MRMLHPTHRPADLGPGEPASVTPQATLGFFGVHELLLSVLSIVMPSGPRSEDPAGSMGRAGLWVILGALQCMQGFI